MIDKNIESIRQKLLDRSQVGIVKYGCTTERDDFDMKQWLIEAQNEALDLAVYCEAMLNKLNEQP